MLARKRTSQSWAACESLGSKVSKTLRSVTSVSRSLRLSLVLARPEEGLAAGDVLDVVGDRAARLQDLPGPRAEVVADRADRRGPRRRTTRRARSGWRRRRACARAPRRGS